MSQQAENVVPAVAPPQDRLASLNKQLKKGKRPTVLVQVVERHIGLPVIDPAAKPDHSSICPTAL